MTLVMVRAIIREDRLAEVLKALVEAGFVGATVYTARGMGGEGGVVEVGGRHVPVLLPRAVVEVVTDEKEADRAVEAIMKSARTGAVGDGRIFVYRVDKAIRIRTSEVYT
ncbi:MAG: P-II family nitrogen regulator [Thermoproteus sp.]